MFSPADNPTWARLMAFSCLLSPLGMPKSYTLQVSRIEVLKDSFSTSGWYNKYPN